MSELLMQPVMIMAGGTGGHVYPALAVADELRSRGVPVIWMGTRKGIEARLVPQAGIDIEWLGMHGIRGKGVKTLLLAPLKMMSACYQALKILRHRQPAVVLGMGGFVSAPGGLMARLARIPLLIHEQNAVPGMSNKFLSWIATRVFEAFPQSFNTKAEHVGNPVRDAITAIEEPEIRLQDRSDTLNILIFGGSLGAMKLNQVVPEACKIIGKDKSLNIRHQTGKGHLQKTQQNYLAANIEAEVIEYIDNMPEMYAWADLVICRAGAMTVSELAAAGVASILVPYPYAVDDHQTANAHYLSDAEAGILIQQNELTAEGLAQELMMLDRKKIIDMAVCARKLGKPESTRQVAQACIDAGGYHVN